MLGVATVIELKQETEKLKDEIQDLRKIVLEGMKISAMQIQDLQTLVINLTDHASMLGRDYDNTNTKT